ncbi:DNA-3-methyladenine glycosylase I [Clostridium sp. DL1XJH146]
MSKRCDWAGKNELMIKYHDTEWGKEVHDDKILFEFLILESAQAGLSWQTILNKRETYRKAYDGFEPCVVASYDENKVEELLKDPGIIRNRRKVESSILNAKIFLQIQKDYGSFNDFLWQFVDGKQIVNEWITMDQVPVITELSDRVSKTLKKMGMKFVGPTIIYSYLQAVGVVNDHLIECFFR